MDSINTKSGIKKTTSCHTMKKLRIGSERCAFVLANLIFYPTFLGSAYQFAKFELDARKY